MAGVLKTVAADGMGDGAFLVGLNDPLLSNEQAILLANPSVAYPSGTVLGKITASGKYTALAPAAGDGSQNAAAILYTRKEISATDQRVTIVARRQVVNGNLLTYLNAVTAPQKAAAEAALANAMLMVRY